MAVTLLPHQIPLSGTGHDFVFGEPRVGKSSLQREIEEEIGSGRSEFTPDVILETMIRGQCGTGKAEPMTKEERDAANRGIDDMINQRIANDGRVAEVYAKLRAIQNINPPIAVDRVFAKLKGK